MEAFTNNTSLLKNKLTTFTRSDLLYLPVILLNGNQAINPTIAAGAGTTDIPTGGYIVTADETTSLLTGWTANSLLTRAVGQGVIRGRGPNARSNSPVVFDQGLNSPDLSVQKMQPGNPLRETAYLVEVDNRLLSIATPADTSQLARPSFIDDDSIASYYFVLNSNSGYFAAPDGTAPETIPAFQLNPGSDVVGDPKTVIGNSTTTGRYGTRFGVMLRASDNLATSNTLFTQLGNTTASNYLGSGQTFRFIDTTLRVTGFTTGYRVDVPLRLIKKV